MITGGRTDGGRLGDTPAINQRVQAPPSGLGRRRFVKLLSTAVAGGAAGCARVDAPEVGWRPLTGVEQKTPNYWIPFWWDGPGGAFSTPEEAGIEIERVHAAWMKYYDERWGDMEDWELLMATIYVDIQLFTGGTIRGNDPSGDTHTYGIFWYDHNQVDVAMATPYHWDRSLGIYTQGLEVLIHEWSHCARAKRNDIWFHP